MDLSRQFLFRQTDVGHPKSVCGALVVQKWNPAVNIEALEAKVGADSEDRFDAWFWESLLLCWNTLDNVEAQEYTDARCLFYSKPLLASGKLGTKCNHEVVLPFQTSSYNNGKESDADKGVIAMCTLRSFLYLPKHCIDFVTDRDCVCLTTLPTYRYAPPTLLAQCCACWQEDRQKVLRFPGWRHLAARLLIVWFAMAKVTTSSISTP